MTNARIGRVAFRVEGDKWCAYFAHPDTSEGQVFLASIAASAATGEMRNRFMNLARDIAKNALPEPLAAGDWADPTPAPEHEKAGRA
jgi:hypothetical protein